MSKLTTHTPTTYDEAREVFRDYKRLRRNGDTTVILGNNTTLHACDVNYPENNAPAYAVRLHATDVVTFYRNGTIRLDTGGYYSRTTADRMHRFTPVSVRVNIRRAGNDPRMIVSVADGREMYTDWQGEARARLTFRELVTSRDGEPVYLAPDTAGGVSTFREVTDRETIGATR